MLYLLIKGEIKGTAFNEDADRLYPIVELNKVIIRVCILV